MILKSNLKCPKCHKEIGIKSEFPFGSLFIYTYTCGHFETRQKLQIEETPEVPKEDATLVNETESFFPLADPKISLNNKNTGKYFQWMQFDKKQQNQRLIDENLASVDFTKAAYEYQETGVRFAEKTDFNCLIGDAMGLGKTIQGILTVKRNRTRLTPCIVLVKQSTVFQWTREIKNWYCSRITSAMPVLDRIHIVPGFDFYVVSKDLIYRKGVKERLVKLNPKFLILDEVQDFKDPSSKRTIGLIELITEAKIEHKVALSGTAIKNNTLEYFTILNLLDPLHFHSRKEFAYKWLEPNEKGIPTRLKFHKIEQFRELTSKYIIRREKHEVLKNLPKLTRNFTFVKIENEGIRKSYNHTLDLFDNFMQNTARVSSKDILGWLAKLRHITGLAKVTHAVEYVEQFMKESDEKLAVGFHHKGVQEGLRFSLQAKGYSPLEISGEDDVYRKDRAIRLITETNARLLNIQMISGGVGLNIQAINNALVLERCWTSADEEQFEARFHRDGQKLPVAINYMIAEGTLDHFFHETVTEKREILNETLSSDKLDISQDYEVSNLLKNLAEVTISSRI